MIGDYDFGERRLSTSSRTFSYLPEALQNGHENNDAFNVYRKTCLTQIIANIWIGTKAGHLAAERV